jgi:aminotransferase in exopolysaccharide biosynthesis
MIPLSVPSLKGNEWLYIKECIDTEWVSTAGKYVDTFEMNVAAFTGAAFSVACVNGTAALHVALRVLNVQPGDEVIVPTVTFIAPVNVIRYVGAEPVFVDCDEYYNIDIEKTLDFIHQETIFRNNATYNKRTGKRIAAVIPVHVFGNAVRLEELVPVCRERCIKVVEDASESLGTVYSQGSLTGKSTGTIGDIGCFSFNGNKIITTGGGGMIVTNNAEYAARSKYLTTQAKDDDVRYVHNDVGYNFRLTNLQAAMGVAQLEQLPRYLGIKREHYLTYKREIDQIPGLRLADAPRYARNNHWMYCLQITAEIYGRDRDELMDYLTENGVQTRPVWMLNHLQSPYRGCQSYKIDQAQKLHALTLNIPCSVSLTDAQIRTVVDRLKG